MPIKHKNFPIIGSVILLGLLLVALFFLFPWLFKSLIIWQKEVNELLSRYLHQVEQQPIYAGSWLILISFLYGVFHALGPGHGKFIIASYLSTHQSKLRTSMYLSLFSSIMQGIVAIVAVSILVVMLNLSSSYFKLSQLWLERVAFGLIALLGISWSYKSAKALFRLHFKTKKTFKIQRIMLDKTTQSAVKNAEVFSTTQKACSCGHQHAPSADQLKQVDSLKSQILVILSIGMRPCTGAIFVLFLSYMLDLYPWGIAATLFMSIGTGGTLSFFALLVIYTRQTAIRLAKWYLPTQKTALLSGSVKLVAGLLLIAFAMSLIYSTTLPSTGGAVLFGR